MTLTATDVRAQRGADRVLDGVSLAVSPGEIVAVIGPSGVGKTTLLELLGVASEPDAGTVALDGVDPWAVDRERRIDLRRRTATVFQTANLFNASVAGNVAYGLRVRRPWSARIRSGLRHLVDGTEFSETVHDALAVVGLAESANQPATSLSGGEAQRVSFARALAVDPDVLLLDEPTSDLDPRNTAVIEDAVQEAAARDIGVVVATHDMHQAERVADRVAVLLGETFAEVGPTETVFENPTDSRTRQFVDGELIY